MKRLIFARAWAYFCLAILLGGSLSAQPPFPEYKPVFAEPIINSVSRVALHPNDKLAAYSDFGGRIFLANIHTEEVLKILTHNSSHVRVMVFSEDSSWLAIGNDNGFVTIWDATSGKKTSEIKLHERGVTSIQFINGSPGQLMTSSWDGSVKIFDFVNGKTLKTIEISAAPITACLLAADEERFICSNDKGEISILNLETGEIISKWDAYPFHTTQIDRSPDGEYLLSFSKKESEFHIWSLRDGRLVKSVALEENISVNSAAFLPDGKSIVYIIGGAWGRRKISEPLPTYPGSLVGLNLDDGKELFRIEVNAYGIYDLAVTRDGTQAVTPNAGNGMGQYDLTTKRFIGNFGDEFLGLESWKTNPIDPNELVGIFWNKPTRMYFMPQEDLGESSVRVLKLGESALSQRIISQTNAYAYDVEYLPESGKICFRKEHGGIYGLFVRNLKKTGTEISLSPGENVSDYELSAEENRVATTDIDGNIKIWNIDDQKLLSSINSDNKQYDMMRLSGDGEHLLTLRNGNHIEIWDANNGDRLEFLKIETESIKQLRFLAGGERFIALDQAGNLFICNVKHGAIEARYEYKGKPTGYSLAAFSPDNRYLLISGNDQNVSIRNLATMKIVRTITDARLNGQSGVLTANADRIIVSVSSGSSYTKSRSLFHIYDVSTDELKLLLSIAFFRDAEQPFVFTPDGYYDGAIEVAERCFAYVKGLESLQGNEKRQMLEYYRKPGLARERLK